MRNVFILICCALLLSAAKPPPPPLTLQQVIPLAGVHGRIDHLAIDLQRSRLFVAELGNDTVDVVDLASGRVRHRIGGLSAPQGLGYAPGADVLIVANAGDGAVRLFHGQDYTPAGSLMLGADADDVRIDPRTGHALVGYGAGGLAVIDPHRATKLATIALPAHPEGFELLADGRVLVNLPDAREIGVVDLAAGRQTGAWRNLAGAANFPMALSPEGQQVAVGFRAPPSLVLYDSGGGQTLREPACADADDVFFDARRARIYLLCGAGRIGVLQRQAMKLPPLPPIFTTPGARTGLFVPELDLLFVARPASGQAGAAILVYRPASPSSIAAAAGAK